MRNAIGEVVYASAGTGKTWNLTRRYREALESGADPGEILATTFTRLAAAEILNRVLKDLADVGPADAGVLSRFWNGADSLHIVTIDSFLSSITSVYRYRAGIPAGIRLTDNASPEAKRLLSASITAALAMVDRPGLDDLLSQLAPASDLNAPAARLLESVMELQALYIESGDEPWRHSNPPRVDESRYEMAASQLDRAAETAAGNANLQKLLIKCAAACRTLHPPETGTETASKISETGTYSRKAVSDGVTAACVEYRDISLATLQFDTAAKTHGLANLLKRLMPIYAEERMRAGIAFFDDVAQAAAEIVGSEGAADVWRRMSWPVTNMMLDEFQDTSRLQWRVLLPLAQRCMAGSPESSLFVVGDVKQAIYGWRGGCASIMQDLPQTLPGIRKRDLTLSFRSSQVLLNCVNQIFEGLPSNSAFSGPDIETAAVWSAAFLPHEANDAARPGYVAVYESPFANEARNNENEDDENDKEAYVRCTPHVACVADRTQELLDSHPGATVAVLAQRRAVVRLVVAELRARGIPTTGEGGEQPDEDPAIEHVLAVFTLVDHPGDSVCEYAVRHSPVAEAFGLRRAEALADWIPRMRRRLIEDGFATTISTAQSRLIAGGQVSTAQAERLTMLARLADAFDARGGRAMEFVDEVRHAGFPVRAGSSVRVMTVHAAKGLQFDAVVVGDLDRAIPGRQPKAIPSRATPGGPITAVTCWPNTQLQIFDEGLNRAASSWRAEQVQEGLNGLYVALTRARQCLVLVLPAARPHRLTGAAIVRVGLNLPSADGMPGCPAAYTSGEVNWSLTRAPEPEIEQVVVGQPRLASGAEAKRRYLPTRSPSAHESAVIRGSDLFQHSSSNAQEHGTAIHAMLSTVEWMDEHAPDNDTLSRALEAAGVISGPTDDRLQRLVTEFRAILARPAVTLALSRTSWPPADDVVVWRERRFVAAGADALITGIFDRVVITRREGEAIAADIIDYKTDFVPPGGADSLDRLYESQLAAYRSAAALMLGLDERQVTARLLLVGGGA